MYIIAFSGEIHSEDEILSPIIYSLDQKEWYLPNGKLYKTVKIDDEVPISGKKYLRKTSPRKKFTPISICSNDNPILISSNGNVNLYVGYESYKGQGYMSEFFMVCPIPLSINNKEMIFRDQMYLIDNISLPEYPFIEKDGILIIGNVSYKPESNIIHSRYNNNNSPCYCIDNKDVYLSCSDDDDYLKKIRMSCIPCNEPSLKEQFPEAIDFLLDGYFNRLVVKYSDDIEVYPLKSYYSPFGLGNYVAFLTMARSASSVNKISNDWKQYYHRRLMNNLSS